MYPDYRLMQYPLEANMVLVPEKYRTESLIPAGELCPIDIDMAKSLYSAVISSDSDELVPNQPVSVTLNPGQQKDYKITNPQVSMLLRHLAMSIRLLYYSNRRTSSWKRTIIVEWDRTPKSSIGCFHLSLTWFMPAFTISSASLSLGRLRFSSYSLLDAVKVARSMSDKEFWRTIRPISLSIIFLQAYQMNESRCSFAHLLHVFIWIKHPNRQRAMWNMKQRHGRRWLRCCIAFPVWTLERYSMSR